MKTRLTVTWSNDTKTLDGHVVDWTVDIDNPTQMQAQTVFDAALMVLKEQEEKETKGV